MYYQNVLKNYDQDEKNGLDQAVFWRCMTKENIFVLFLKTTSEEKDKRRLEDVLKTSLSRQMFAGVKG